MTTADAKLRIEKSGALARLVINNPARRNAVSLAMWQAFPPLLKDLADDPSVRCVIVEGAGDKAFSAGNDISEFKDVRATPAQVAVYNQASEEAYGLLKSLPKPTIAKVRGACVGGGVELTQLCDLQVAAETARFAVTPAKLGLGYKLEDVLLLKGALSPKHAKEFLFTGHAFSASDALRFGLVNRVVPDAILDTHVQDLAETIAANAPLSVKAAKLIVNEAVKERAERDTALCQDLVDACHLSEDYKEGAQAFMEKRKPRFQGH